MRERWHRVEKDRGKEENKARANGSREKKYSHKHENDQFIKLKVKTENQAPQGRSGGTNRWNHLRTRGSNRIVSVYTWAKQLWQSSKRAI